MHNIDVQCRMTVDPSDFERFTKATRNTAAQLLTPGADIT